MVNRPINAFNDQLNLRLADYPDNGEAYVAARNTLLSYAMEKNNDQLAQAVHTLDEELGTLSSVFIWERYAGQTAVPLIKEGLDAGGDYSEDEVALAQVSKVIDDFGRWEGRRRGSWHESGSHPSRTHTGLH